MRYMMLIKHPDDYHHKDVPPSLFPAMGEFVQESIRKGVLLDGAGLKPLTYATRVRLAGGKIKVTDGPFAEAKEVVGGYSICEFKTHEEAIEMAKGFMEVHRIHWPSFEGECEVRPLEDMG